MPLQGDVKREMGEFLLQEKEKQKSNPARTSQKPTVLLRTNQNIEKMFLGTLEKSENGSGHIEFY